VLFDGDAAGLRASLRGVDLILEEGLNVRVCSFPEGQDPDSFARKHSRDAIEAFLKDQSRDFIQFKTALLTEEAANDPIKRAETIRDIVGSIARIPDRIKREVYIQECASLMGISESVLFDTLAQMGEKRARDAARQPARKQMEVVPPDPKETPVDIQYELERKIIEVLLLYGQQSEEFEDLLLKENEDGELVLEPERSQARVFEKIFLDLQEDEIELSHQRFRSIYYKLIDKLNSDQPYSLQDLMGEFEGDMIQEISSILMDEERYELHQWERKEIYPKPKEQGLAQLVSETILSLRCYLIQKRIGELRKQTETQTSDTNREVLEDIMNYLQLNKLLNEKLNRVLS
jgi:DNA primase